jgi:hypothetical protein
VSSLPGGEGDIWQQQLKVVRTAFYTIAHAHHREGEEWRSIDKAVKKYG